MDAQADVAGPADCRELRFGRFEVVPASRRVVVDGVVAKLGGRAFDVLMVLMSERGRVVTKDELFDRVWPKLVVEENNLHVHIAALRRLLGPDAIVTVPGRGYQLTASPAPAEPSAIPLDEEPDREWSVDAGPLVVTACYRPRRVCRATAIKLVAVLSAFAVAGWLAAWRVSHEDATAPARVAVLERSDAQQPATHLPSPLNSSVRPLSAR
jgi:DNA-binding winged helix-turn-helix (wHTH) protein